MRSPLRDLLLMTLVLVTAALPQSASAYALYATGHVGPTGASNFYRLLPSPVLVGPIGFNRVGAIDTHPFTHELYACGQRTSDNTPVLIRIDRTTGAGTEIGPTGILGSISDIAFRPLDGMLFAHDADPNEHRLYTIDITTGAATLVGTTNVEGAGNGIDFAVDNSLYLLTSTNVYKLNHTTGAAVDYGPIVYTPNQSGNPAALDLGGDGFMYIAMKFVTHTTLAYFIPNTNNVNYFGGVLPTEIDGLAFDSRPHGYAASGTGGAASDLYRIDLTTGLPTLIGPIGFDGVGAMDFYGVSEGNRDLYATARRPGTSVPVLITIDSHTGQGTEVGPTGIPAEIADLTELSATGRIAGYQPFNDPDQSLYEFNIETGAASLIGHTGLQNDAGNGIAELPTTPAIYKASHDELHLLDANNGSAFLIAPLTYLPPINTFNARPPALDFNWNGTLYALARETAGDDRVSLARIDLVGHTITQIADTGNPSLDGLAVRTDVSPLTHVTDPDGGETYGIGTTQPITWDTFQDQTVPSVDLSYTTGVELYASTSGASADLYRIDLTTGAATLVGPTGYDRVGGLATHPLTGVLYGVAEIFGNPILIRIDPLTGSGTLVGTTESQPIGDIAFRPADNALFAFNVFAADHTLQRLNLQIGNATLVGSTGLSASGGNGMEFVGNTLYHSNVQNLHTLDTSSGAATVVAPMSFSAPVPPGEGRVAAMKRHPGTGIMYALVKQSSAPQPTYLGTVDLATGHVTIIGNTNVPALDGMAFVPGPWTPIVNDTPNDGSYAWTVPNTPTPLARVRIEAREFAAFAGSDISDRVFTIQDVTAAPLPGQPTLALLGLIAPNPSRGTTAVAYSLSSDAHVLLTIHDVLGRRVATLLDGRKVSGTWTARWSGHDVGGAIAPSGMYWVRFAVDGRVQTGRFTLLR